ncbi:AEC family transporter [Oscillospiraceae bacterium MB08-C2-2]|nr:AEC family transporter [Oscillospiraceae bacterium MB08-C2-2]
MELALVLAQQVAIMFLLISVGIVCERKGIITLEAAKNFCNFLLIVIIPLLSIKSLHRDKEPELMQGFWVAFGFSVVFHIVAIVIATLAIPKREDVQYRAERLATVFSNCGFIGFPLVTAALGAEGLFYAAAFNGVFVLLSWSYSSSVLSGKTTLNFKKLLWNPGVIGFAVGMLLFFTGLRLPAIPEAVMENLYVVNAPLSMVITGVILSRIKLRETLTDWRIYRAALLRVLVIPLTVIGLAWALGIGKWSSSARIAILASVICCSCGSGISCILMPARFGGDSETGAKIVGVSTTMTLVTLPLIILLTDAIL